jgi:hypothetical protein
MKPGNFVTLLTAAPPPYPSPPQAPYREPVNPTSTVTPNFSNYILLLFFHIRLGSPFCLFQCGSPTAMFYACLIFSKCATCSAHLLSQGQMGLEADAPLNPQKHTLSFSCNHTKDIMVLVFDADYMLL